jgi:lysozyme
MKISNKGVGLVKHFEGLFLMSYLCPAQVWTIGYGHTGIKHNDGTVKRGMKITQEKAEGLLAMDLNTKYAPDVLKAVKVKLEQHQFDALVAFHFNTGALNRSTLLRKLNAGDFSGAAEEFGKWTKARDKSGKLVVLNGLVRRRKAERHLFETGEVKFFN